MKRTTLITILVLSIVTLFGVAVGSTYALADGSLGSNCVGCHPTGGGGEVSDISTATPDATAPVTTCDSTGVHYGNAVVNLTGTDNEWGVKYLYYAIDGHRTRETSVTAYTYKSVPASFTLTAPSSGWTTYTVEYWSQDNYGNVEAVNTMAIRVNAPKTTSVTVRSSASTTYLYRYVTLTSVLKGGVPAGTRVRLEVRRPGSSSYVLLSNRTVGATGIMSSYKYRMTKRGYYYFRVKYLGATSFKASTSSYVRVVVR